MSERKLNKPKANSSRLFWCNCAVKCFSELPREGSSHKRCFSLSNTKIGCQHSYCITSRKSTVADCGASLRNLCEVDKQRVRWLITELAQAQQMKDVTEKKLNRERCQFKDALLQMNQHLVSLEKDKISLQNQLTAIQEDVNISHKVKTTDTKFTCKYLHRSPSSPHILNTTQSPVTLSSEIYPSSQFCTSVSQQQQRSQGQSDRSRHTCNSPTSQSVKEVCTYTAPCKITCESRECAQSPLRSFHILHNHIPTDLPLDCAKPSNCHTSSLSESWVSLPALPDKQLTSVPFNTGPQTPVHPTIFTEKISVITDNCSTIPDNSSFHANEYVEKQSGNKESDCTEAHGQPSKVCIGVNVAVVDVGTQTGCETNAVIPSVISEVPITIATFNTMSVHDTVIPNTGRKFQDVSTGKCYSSRLPQDNRVAVSSLDLAVSLNQHLSMPTLCPAAEEAYGSLQISSDSSPVDPDNFVEENDLMNVLFFRSY